MTVVVKHTNMNSFNLKEDMLKEKGRIPYNQLAFQVAVIRQLKSRFCLSRNDYVLLAVILFHSENIVYLRGNMIYAQQIKPFLPSWSATYLYKKLRYLISRGFLRPIMEGDKRKHYAITVQGRFVLTNYNETLIKAINLDTIC